MAPLPEDARSDHPQPEDPLRPDPLREDALPEDAPLAPEDEVLLAALLTGERREDEGEVQARLLARPALRDRWDHVRALATDLDSAGADDREFLDAALRQPSQLEPLAREIALRLRSRPHPFRRGLLAAAAAAALIGILLTVWWQRPRAATERSSLGVAAGELWPRGAVQDFELFRWNLPCPPEGHYLLRFFADGPGGKLLFEQIVDDSMQWRPDRDRRAQMTASMAWEVEVRDRSGNTKGGAGPVTIFKPR
jgi:hypothetical protein